MANVYCGQLQACTGSLSTAFWLDFNARLQSWLSNALGWKIVKLPLSVLVSGVPTARGS